MNRMKLLVAVTMSTVALTAAPVVQASTGDDFTPGEVAYLSDVVADGMGASVSVQGVVDEGWTICRALSAGMSPTAAAGKVYAGSRSSHGADGVTQAQATRVVTHAMDDLCPLTTPNTSFAT